MRILFLIHHLRAGGAEKQLSLISRALVLVGCEVHICYVNGEDQEDVYLRMGVYLHKLEANSGKSIKIFASLYQLVTKIQPQIVQSWIINMDFYGSLVCQILGIIFVIREPSNKYTWTGRFRYKLREISGRLAGNIIANSEGGCNYWRTLSLPPKNIELINNAIDFEKIKQAESYLPKSGSPKLMVCGRLNDREKNFTNVLNVFLNCLDIPNWSVCFLGDGPQQKEGAILVNECNATERINFTTWTPRVYEHMQNATHLINLSNVEGQPNVVLEGAVCGLHLLLSDIPSHRELGYFLDAKFVDQTNVERMTFLVREMILGYDGKSQPLHDYKILHNRTPGKIAQNYLYFYQKLIREYGK